MGKNHIKDVYTVLIANEKLKRLLWYPPEDLLTDTPSPLSPTLPIIGNSETLNWKVIEDRILLNSKSDDLVDGNPICRLYLYLGDVNTTGHSVFIKQEIIVDILWHEMFTVDSRLDSITQTLKSLLVGKHITGIGKMEYNDGMPINAPKNYSGYRHVFQVGSTKL
jgi:hypothetical protein